MLTLIIIKKKIIIIIIIKKSLYRGLKCPESWSEQWEEEKNLLPYQDLNPRPSCP
jgi:hypothetical protein